MKEVWYQLTSADFYMRKVFEHKAKKVSSYLICVSLKDGVSISEAAKKYKPEDKLVMISECGKFFTLGEVR